ncbi:MAG: hypothetical protein ABIQ74_09315 [Chitinophagales bacterium]
MKSKGRPATRPIQLMDGFYIEVRNRGSHEKAIKIRCINKETMDATVTEYRRKNKEVTILGEHKDFAWTSEKKVPKQKKVAV